MPQISKALKSRAVWKNKAVKRATEIRKHRKTEKRHLNKIAELKRHCFQSDLIIEEKKGILHFPVDTLHSNF